MLKDSFVIYRKELKNIMKDRRAIFSVFILPMIILPIIFLTIGFVTSAQQRTDAETLYVVNIIGDEDGRFAEVLQNFLVFERDEARVPDYTRAMESENYIIVELEGTDSDLTQVGNTLDARIYYRSTSRRSNFAAQQVRNALNQYSSMIMSERLRTLGLSLGDLNPVKTEMQDLAPEEARGTEFLAIMLPYFVLIFIFAGSMNIGLDTTAGEKERGSLAPVLVNQVSRTSIALGKVFYVMTVAVLNSFFTFVGLMVAFILGGSEAFGGEIPVNLAGFGIGSLIALLLVLLVLAGFAASLIILIGSFARNMKEGAGYVMPFYLLAIFAGIATMNMESVHQIHFYALPLVNSVFVMKDILTLQFFWSRFVVMLLSNLLYTSLLVLGVARLFNSEKVLNTGS